MMLTLSKLALAAALFGYSHAVPADASLESLYATTWTETVSGTPSTIVATIDSPYPTVVTTTENGSTTTYTTTVWGSLPTPAPTESVTTDAPVETGTTTCLTGW